LFLSGRFLPELDERVLNEVSLEFVFFSFNNVVDLFRCLNFLFLACSV
jgi:hypothetical protein